MSVSFPPVAVASVVRLLDRAARECVVRGGTASFVGDDLTTWYLDAQLVRVAAETLRGAAVAGLSELPPFEVATGLSPLQLLLAARDELDDIPDDLEDLPLFLGRLRLSDALSAVRARNE